MAHQGIWLPARWSPVAAGMEVAPLLTFPDTEQGGWTMPENTTPLPEIQARLHDVARLLRESDKVDPSSRQILAELVDELGEALRSSQVPPEEVAQLAGTTAHLAEALH